MFFKIQPVDGTAPKKEDNLTLRKSQSCYGTQRPVKKITLAEYPKEFLNLKSDLCKNTKKHLEPEGFFYAHVRVGNLSVTPGRDKYESLAINESTSLSFYTAKNSPLKIHTDKSSDGYIGHRSRHRNNSILKRAPSSSDYEDIDETPLTSASINEKVQYKQSIFRTIVDSIGPRTVGGADVRKCKPSKISFAAQAEYKCTQCPSCKATETETPRRICEETNTERPLTVEDLESYMSASTSSNRSPVKKRKLVDILKSGTSKEPKILVPRSSIKYVEIFDDTDSAHSKVSKMSLALNIQSPAACRDSKDLIVCRKVSQSSCHGPENEAPIQNFFRNLIKRPCKQSEETMKTVCVSWKPCNKKCTTNKNERYIQCPKVTPVKEPPCTKRDVPILYPLEKDSMKRESKTRTLFTPAEPFCEDSCDEEGRGFDDIIKSRKSKNKVSPCPSRTSTVCVVDTKGCANTKDESFVVCPKGSAELGSKRSQKSHKTQTRPRLISADVKECDPEANAKHRKLLEQKASSNKSDDSYKSVCVANEDDMPIFPSISHEKFIMCPKRSCRSADSAKKSQRVQAKPKVTCKKSQESIQSNCVPNEDAMPACASKNNEFLVCPKRSSESSCGKGSCKKSKSNESICIPKDNLPSCSSKSGKYIDCPNRSREKICSIAKESAYGTLSTSKKSSGDPPPADCEKEKPKYYCVRKVTDESNCTGSEKYIKCPNQSKCQKRKGLEYLLRTSSTHLEAGKHLSPNIQSEKSDKSDKSDRSDKSEDDDDSNKVDQDAQSNGSYPEIIKIADTPSLYISPGQSFMETPSLYLSPDISKLAVKKPNRGSSISNDIRKKKKKYSCVSKLEDKKKYESDSEVVELCQKRKKSQLELTPSSINAQLYGGQQSSNDNRNVPKGTYVCVNNEEDKKLYKPGVHVVTCGSKGCKNIRDKEKRVPTEEQPETKEPVPVVLYEAPEKPLENEEDIEDSNFEVFCRPSPIKDAISNDPKKREKAHSYTPSPSKRPKNSSSSHPTETQPAYTSSNSNKDANSFDSHHPNRKRSPQQSKTRIYRKTESSRNVDKNTNISLSCVCNTWKQPLQKQSSDSLTYQEAKSEQQSTIGERASRKKSKTSWESFKRKFKEKLSKCCRSKSRGKSKESHGRDTPKEIPKKGKGRAPDPPIRKDRDPGDRKPPRNISTSRLSSKINTTERLPPKTESYESPPIECPGRLPKTKSDSMCPSSCSKISSERATPRKRSPGRQAARKRSDHTPKRKRSCSLSNRSKDSDHSKKKSRKDNRSRSSRSKSSCGCDSYPSHPSKETCNLETCPPPPIKEPCTRETCPPPPKEKPTERKNRKTKTHPVASKKSSHSIKQPCTRETCPPPPPKEEKKHDNRKSRKSKSRTSHSKDSCGCDTNPSTTSEEPCNQETCPPPPPKEKHSERKYKKTKTHPVESKKSSHSIKQPCNRETCPPPPPKEEKKHDHRKSRKSKSRSSHSKDSCGCDTNPSTTSKEPCNQETCPPPPPKEKHDHRKSKKSKSRSSHSKDSCGCDTHPSTSNKELCNDETCPPPPRDKGRQSKRRSTPIETWDHVPRKQASIFSRSSPTNPSPERYEPCEQKSRREHSRKRESSRDHHKKSSRTSSKSKSKESVKHHNKCPSCNNSCNKTIDLSLSCDSSSIRMFQENEAIYFEADENGVVESPAVFKKPVDSNCVSCDLAKCGSFCKKALEHKRTDKERRKDRKHHKNDKRSRTPESDIDNVILKKSSESKNTSRPSSSKKRNSDSDTRLREKEDEACEVSARIDHKNRRLYIDCPNYERCLNQSFTNCPNEVMPKRGKKDLLKSKFVRQSSIAKIIFDIPSKTSKTQKSKSRLRSGSGTCKLTTSKKIIKYQKHPSTKIIQKHSVVSIGSSCAYISFKSCSSGCPNMCSSGSLFGNSCPFAYVNKSNQSLRLHSGANQRNSKSKKSKDCLCEDSFSREKFIGHQKPTLQSVKLKQKRVKPKLSNISYTSNKPNERLENHSRKSNINFEHKNKTPKSKTKCFMLEQVSDTSNKRSTRNRISKKHCNHNCSFESFSQTRGQVRSGHKIKNNNDKSKSSLSERLKNLLKSTSNKKSKESVATKEYKTDNLANPRKKWKDEKPIIQNRTSLTSEEECSEECKESCIFINTDFGTKKKQQKDKISQYKTPSQSSILAIDAYTAYSQQSKKSEQKISKRRNNSSYKEPIETVGYKNIDDCRYPPSKILSEKQISKNKLEELKNPSTRSSNSDNCKCPIESKSSELISKMDYRPIKDFGSCTPSQNTVPSENSYEQTDPEPIKHIEHIKEVKSKGNKFSRNFNEPDDFISPDMKSYKNKSSLKLSSDSSQDSKDEQRRASFATKKSIENEYAVRPTTSPNKFKPTSEIHKSHHHHKTSPSSSSIISCISIEDTRPKTESQARKRSSVDIPKMNYSDDITYKIPTSKKSSKKLGKSSLYIYSDVNALKTDSKCSKNFGNNTDLPYSDDVPLKPKYSIKKKSSRDLTDKKISYSESPSPKKDHQEFTEICCHTCCSYEFINQQPSSNSDDLQDVFVTDVPENFEQGSSSREFDRDLIDTGNSDTCSRDLSNRPKLHESSNSSESVISENLPPFKRSYSNKKSNLSTNNMKDRAKKKSNVTVRDSTPSYRSFDKESPPADISPPRSPKTHKHLSKNVIPSGTPSFSELSTPSINKYKTFCTSPNCVKSMKSFKLSVDGCLCNSFVAYKNSKSLKKLFEKKSPSPSVEEDESGSKVMSTISDDSFLVRKGEKSNSADKNELSNESTPQDLTVKSKTSSMSSVMKKSDTVAPLDYKEFIKSIDNYLKCKMDKRECAGKQSPSPLSVQLNPSTPISEKNNNKNNEVNQTQHMEKKKAPKKVPNSCQVRCIKACLPDERTNVGCQAKCPKRSTKARTTKTKSPITKYSQLTDMAKISTDLLHRKIQMSKMIENKPSSLNTTEGSINLKGGNGFPNISSKTRSKVKQPKRSLSSIPSVNIKICSGEPKKKTKCRKSCRPTKFDRTCSPWNTAQFIWDDQQHHMRYVKKVPSKNKRDICTTMSKKDSLMAKKTTCSPKITDCSSIIEPCFPKVDSIKCNDSCIEKPKINRPCTSPPDKFCTGPRGKCTPSPKNNSCNSSITKKSSTVSCYANQVMIKCCGVSKKKPAVVRPVIYPKWTEPKPGPGLIQYKDRISSFACADPISQKGVDYSEKLLDLVRKKKKEIEQLRVKLDKASKKYDSTGVSRQITPDDSKSEYDNKINDIGRGSFNKPTIVNSKKTANTSRPISQRMSFVDDPPYCSMSNFLSDVSYKNMKAMGMENLDVSKTSKTSEYYCRGLLPRWIYKQNTKSDDNEL